MASSETVVVPLHLLLLPPVPWPSTRDTLKAAYTAPITAVLKQLTLDSRHATLGARLDIALPVPYLEKHRARPKRELFPKIQALIAGVYKLICVIAAKDKINVEDAEGIDVRVLLLAHPRHDNEPRSDKTAAAEGRMIGPVIDLTTLAHAQRPWAKVFSVGNDEGDKILQNFLVNQDTHVRIHKVPGGDVTVSDDDSEEELDTKDTDETRHHRSIAVGGTFDHIHIGHKHLLTMFAFMLPEDDSTTENERCLTIGITNDELLKNKKYPDLLQSWDDRQRATSDFLQSILDFRPPATARPEHKVISDPGPNGHAVHVRLVSNLVLKLVEIGDPFGPTITDESISVLVISAETRAGGKAVNEKRADKGWPTLEVFEVDVLDAEDEADGAVDETFQSKLSSTQIRQSIREKAKLRSKV